FKPQGAIAYAQAAVTLDPDFLDAWESLAVLHLQQMVMHPATAAEGRQLANDAFKRAIALCNESSRAKFLESVRLQVIDRDWIGAGEAFRDAIQPTPGAVVMAAPEFFSGAGRLTDLVERYREMLRFDPL